MSKNTYKEMLNSIKPSKEEELYLNSRVLLVDSMNTFLRSFAMINHMNPAGAHIGGLTGFLKSVILLGSVMMKIYVTILIVLITMVLLLEVKPNKRKNIT